MPEENDTVYVEEAADGVRVVYLNQPKKKNAISGEMMGKLAEILAQIENDEAAKVVILRGAGNDFSSGGDLNQPVSVPGPEGARLTLMRYLNAIRAIRSMCKPVIAMVDGFAVGGAFSMALACDLIYASDKAVFAPAFCQIGIIPEMGMMEMLPKLVGAQRAKEIIFFGERISSERLCALGVVNEVFSQPELFDKTKERAASLAAMPDASIQIAKSIMNSLSDGNLDKCMIAESTASPFCTTTKAYEETMKRFKR